jgi:hypothetical protein
MSVATARVQALRRRRREGRILLPRIEISQELTDHLVDAGMLAEWDTECPQAIADAIIKLLERIGNDVPD